MPEPHRQPQLREGRVIRVDAKVCHVDVDGERIHAVPRGSLFEDLGEAHNPIAVGDLVRVSTAGDPPGIEEVLPRRNYLGRTKSMHDPREQVLVANVDQVFLVMSLSRPGFSSSRADRILAACFWHDIPATVILNKSDLARPGETESIHETYERIPVPVLVTSATEGTGVDEVREGLRDKVTVFYGPSGAGKSTLLNRVQPGLNLKEGKVSQYWKQGRHTTSYSTLHPLDAGGYAIDTPGIRVFRLHGLHRRDLRGLFPDFEPFQRDCRYPNCTHDHEPDCAVADAVEEGRLAETRYASYVELLDETDPEHAYEPEDDVEPDPEAEG